MKLDETGIDFIKTKEDLKLIAYKPNPNDVWTIGYGHTKNVTEGMIIDENVALQYLDEDLSHFEDVVNSLVKVSIKQNQFNALVSFCYNCGEGSFRQSTALTCLNKRNYSDCAKAILLWNKIRNKKTGVLEFCQGLANRRQDEKDLFESY